jgi:pimeloyl-ACP methyl ester carboxylesterase
MIPIAGIDIEVHEDGSGEPILFLHSAQGFLPDHPYVRLLAQKRRVIAPSHPGFGGSGLPMWLSTADDIAHVHLELMDKLGLAKNGARIDVVGASIGGWIAAEMATKAPERFKRQVLISPVGVKVGPSDKLDIPDIFAMPPDKVNKLLFHDPDNAKVDVAKLSDEQLTIMVRNRETLALLCWEPWMHNPKLVHRLQRITAPTLFMRGASDGLVSAEYIAAYAKLVPNATIETMPEAGHALPVEQPEAFASRVLSFLQSE